MRDIQYEYSSIYSSAPPHLASDIVEWSRNNIHDHEIFVVRDKPCGRENDIHVTVLYGIYSTKIHTVRNILKEEKRFSIVLGTIDLFTADNRFDVLFINAISPTLIDLNAKLRKELPHRTKHENYQPHITLGYLKRNIGWRHFGKKIFNGLTFECDALTFACADGTRDVIPLQS